MKSRFAVPAVIALFVVATYPGAVRAADNYKVDSVHSTVVFKVDHAGIAPFYGMFNQPTGTISLDKADPGKSTFAFELKIDNVSTGNEKRDAHLKNADFFDAKQFPTISFKSKSVKTDGDKFQVTGDLTMHGVTKEITLALNKTSEKEVPKLGARTGWTTETTIKRSDYGMTGFAGMLGDEVTVMIALQGVKS